MNGLFHGFEFIRAYINDILILTRRDWTYHLHKLKLTLNKLKVKGLKCKIERSFLGQTEMEYLWFWVTGNGVKTINKKIEEITNMKPPTSKNKNGIYRCSELLTRYVGKALKYISAFN